MDKLLGHVGTVRKAKAQSELWLAKDRRTLSGVSKGKGRKP